MRKHNINRLKKLTEDLKKGHKPAPKAKKEPKEDLTKFDVNEDGIVDEEDVALVKEKSIDFRD